MDSLMTQEKMKKGPTFSDEVDEVAEDRTAPVSRPESVHDKEAVDATGRYRGLGTKDDPYVVDWDIGDTEDPYNWPKAKKWPLTMLVSTTHSVVSLQVSSYVRFICLVGCEHVLRLLR